MINDKYKDHLQANPPRFIEDKLAVATHNFGFDSSAPIPTNTSTITVDPKLLTEEQYKDKLVGLVKMVDLLLDTLIGDPTKDIIKWPNRQQKILEWKQKITAYLNDKE